MFICYIVISFIFYYFVYSLSRTPAQPAACCLVLKVNKKTISSLIRSFFVRISIFIAVAGYACLQIRMPSGVPNLAIHAGGLTRKLQASSVLPQCGSYLFPPCISFVMSLAILAGVSRRSCKQLLFGHLTVVSWQFPALCLGLA